VVKNVVAGDRCVKFYLVSKDDNFEWSLIVVYGAAHKNQGGLGVEVLEIKNKCLLSK
jgi:hypothetical protein